MPLPPTRAAYTGPSTAEALAKSLRDLSAEYPKSSLAAGFVPVLGDVLGAAEAWAAHNDPDASTTERVLSTAGALPFLDMVKLLRRAPRADIDVYHGGVTHEGPARVGGGGGEGTYDEGYGLYSTPDPTEASHYAQAARGRSPRGAQVVKYDLPDETLSQYVDLDSSIDKQTAEVKQALRRMYSDVDVPDEDLLSVYKGDILADPKLHAQMAQAEGLRGNFSTDPVSGRMAGPSGEPYYSTFDPADLRKLGVEEAHPPLGMSQQAGKVASVQIDKFLGYAKKFLGYAKTYPPKELLEHYNAGLITKEELIKFMPDDMPEEYVKPFTKALMK